VPVQHHHAHAVAAMAEHHLEGPVLALAWDGTGLGTDGAAWGGELLLAERGRFERLATFRPVALAGGDRAIREPWRVALAALLAAFGADAPLDRLPLFRAVDPKELDVVSRMIAGGVNAPLAHGAGRAFDAAGALALGRPVSRYEGQVAIALDNAAGTLRPRSTSSGQASTGSGRTEDPPVRAEPVEARDVEPYPFDIDGSGTVDQLDLRPLWRALASDVAAGAAPAVVSGRFHAALVRAGAALVRRAASRAGRLPVVLTGGCFQNARLAEGLVSDLSDSFEVYTHVDVPPGDGGIALGQAVVADATAV
jgi:hydrogenase maturation protein HypF